MTKKSRTQVRAENPGGACGKLDHMTIDELKARAVSENFDGTCPACGQFHLTRKDIKRLENIRVADTEKYKKMEAQAMASGTQ